MIGYNVHGRLLLDLGMEGYVFDFTNRSFSPSVAWEFIYIWIEYFTPAMQILLLPWCLSKARIITRYTGLSTGAVIVLTAIASMMGYPPYSELAITLRWWPEWIIKRQLTNLIRSGYLSTCVMHDETCYFLTLHAKLCILVSKPIDDPDLPNYVEYNGKTDLAYHRMLNLMLHALCERIAPVTGYDTGHYFAPIGNLDIVGHGHNESSVQPVLEDSDAEIPLPDDDSTQTMPELEESPQIDFFDGLAEAVNGYAKCVVPLASIVDTVQQCLQTTDNEALRKGFDALGFAALSQAEKAFLLLLCHQFRHNGVEPMILSGYGNILGGRSDDVTNLRRAAGALVALGIAAVPTGHTHTGDSDNDSEERYILSPDAAGAIFKGRSECINYASICHQADVIRAASIQQKTLHFNESMLKDVDTLRTLLNPEKSAELMDRLAKQGRKSLTCLFYGAPGSGKTELARQLAVETGRDIIIADPAKLAGSYVGDGEKNMREIFRVYKYMVKLSDSAPILLYNEADGIISKRLTSVQQYVDKSENAIQSIILQELETLEGVFIAATNLECNLDEAMDRRFLFKLHFDVPSADVRAKILRDKMPWLDVQTAEAIAREFMLSGGQIDNIAARCAIEQFTSGIEPSAETIRTFCQVELSLVTRRGGGTETGKRRIGFAYKGRE